MDMRKVYSLSLDQELVARVDVARGGVPRSRFVEGAVEKALGDGAVHDGVRSVARSVDGPAASSRSSRGEQEDGSARLVGGRGAQGNTVRPPAESKRRVVEGEGTPLPLIAPRRW